jgi:ABC-type transporter Mla maintaining outer membrane lipid asymmetry permease subunit MlaE
LCLFATSNPYFILAALSAGFFGFILGCLHIVAVQRYGIKQSPVALLILSLFLNSVPLIYMMMVVTRQHS